MNWIGLPEKRRSLQPRVLRAKLLSCAGSGQMAAVKIAAAAVGDGGDD